MNPLKQHVKITIVLERTQYIRNEVFSFEYWMLLFFWWQSALVVLSLVCLQKAVPRSQWSGIGESRCQDTLSETKNNKEVSVLCFSDMFYILVYIRNGKLWINIFLLHKTHRHGQFWITNSEETRAPRQEDLATRWLCYRPKVRS